MTKLDERQIAVLIIGALVISSSLIGVGIDRAIRYRSLSVTVLVTTVPTWTEP